MGKYKKVIIFLVAAILLLLIWYFLVRKKEMPPSFTTEVPQYGHIATMVTATGTLRPVDTVAVGTQVSGTLKYLFADFNAKVKKGQLLAQLDKSLFQAQVDQYRGSLEVAKSQLVYQEANFGRQGLLFKTGAISKADYDNAQYQYSAAKASVASVTAQLAAAEKNLSFTDIYSPIDGVVMNRNVSVGQTVAASFNTPTLFVIAKDITKMQVETSVGEADIGNVADSQRVSFTVDAYLDDVFDGQVKEIRLQPSISANVVTYNTIINAANNAMKLKPGMTANVTIYTAEKDTALLLPVRALKFKPDSALLAKDYVIQETVNRHAGNPPRGDTLHAGGAVHRPGTVNYVWILRGDTLQQKRIRTGLDDNTHIEVLSGLSTNDAVITSMNEPGTAAATAKSTGSPFMPNMRRRR
ncbi:efflux RND transporter periplasmic adaptor subunit [Chitinophaga defluvii]|uniref:Efflux RND transporter periplasmic adaptor subunit n=1 Tax=Chitinophaga defluvii TaxID=3163343 RepID=A0ABV2TA00_9BACT